MDIDEMKEMIKAINLPIRASYRPGEVLAILGLSDRHFRRITSNYEENPETGRPLEPYMLKSFLMKRERRVSINELVDFINRNNSYERNNCCAES